MSEFQPKEDVCYCFPAVPLTFFPSLIILEFVYLCLYVWDAFSLNK